MSRPSKHTRPRMYAVQRAQPASASLSSSAPQDAQPATMSRVPITALLRPDAVEKFQLHGRTYYKFKNDMYNFPSDDVEYERLDIMHQLIYQVALNKQLHLAKFAAGPRRILDVGFGTAFWMLDMAKQYPKAEIIGIDLDGIGITHKDNCVFRSPVDFTAPQWPVDDSSVDLIHMAQLCGTVPDWLAHYGKAFRSLRPGTGQIEHVEIDWRPRTTQQHFPREAIDIWNWWGWMQQASERARKPIAYRDDTEDLLEHAGFVDISHKRVRIPFFANARKDRKEAALAHGFQMAMGHVGSQSWTGLSMALFTQYLNFTPQQVQDVSNRVLHILPEQGLPLYITLHVWTARRPQS